MSLHHVLDEFLGDELILDGYVLEFDFIDEGCLSHEISAYCMKIEQKLAFTKAIDGKIRVSDFKAPKASRY